MKPEATALFGLGQVQEPFSDPCIQPATLLALREDGLLLLRDGEGREFLSECLEGSLSGSALAPGDVLLALTSTLNRHGVALGRIGRYQPPIPDQVPDHLTIETTESLTLKCGDSSVSMRADGKLVVRGDDVLVRAKGTQRIRAGNVSIN